MDTEKAVQRLAMLLHNQFCTEQDCKGIVDYMDSARELLPKILTHVVDA